MKYSHDVEIIIITLGICSTFFLLGLLIALVNLVGGDG